jgi:nucleotide-binding universal stress UspA family protein
METTSTHPSLVLGVDGSPSSRSALEWAALEASRRHLPVRLVSAWSTYYAVDTLGLAQSIVMDHCTAILEQARQAIAAVDPTITVTTVTHMGPAALAIVEESVGAELVVVGSRGHRAIPALLIGATSLEVAAHAHCPVVVVREDHRDRPARGSVLVGVEDSEASSEAVGYAFAHASRVGADLVAAHAWPLEYAAGVVSALAAPMAEGQSTEEARAMVTQALAPWREKYPDVRVTTVVEPGRPADLLVERSTDADLVVVGSRGHGLVAGALLGSVGHSVLHGAHCPVAIVRPHATSLHHG